MTKKADLFQLDRHGIRPAPKDTRADLWACVPLAEFLKDWPDQLPRMGHTTCARCGVRIVYNKAEAGPVNRDAPKVCIPCALDAMEAGPAL